MQYSSFQKEMGNDNNKPRKVPQCSVLNISYFCFIVPIYGTQIYL